MPEKIRRPRYDAGDPPAPESAGGYIQQARGQVRADSGASPVNAGPAPERTADTGAQGGMESVPQMSYAASPVQGLFGLNHFRKWRANRTAQKQAAHTASLMAELNRRRQLTDDMADTAAGKRWKNHLMDERARDYAETSPGFAAMQFDETDDGPLAPAGSAAAMQTGSGGSGAVEDASADFDGLLPAAPIPDISASELSAMIGARGIPGAVRKLW